MKANTGINVARVDFSDPQGGKGACDRKAATIKAHVRRFFGETVKVWKAFDVGKGRKISISNLQGKGENLKNRVNNLFVTHRN